ncbi:flagellar basal body P-ring formation chaperone FlgA [Alterinioella nitratireducens]|jgi:flagella basal body P-ring formation protein FlgA|uniref:flagellar basal body P-ring formation chaperone FlgA n=1 Tax=Alterinioella nitratireducens TaxID=2735915 RepID=UPI000C68C44A|nr:flagella basal body P-ring formation protein FlgA [Nioella sp.]
MRWLIPLLFAATPALADTVVANGTIRSMSVIGPADVRLVAGDTPGAILDLAAAIGMEARVNLYPGRPIRPGDLREPAVINRNEIITLQYDANGLLIVTEGRALDRAGIGERLRVLNLSSRTTVTATVQGAGLATVGPSY